MRKPPAFTLPSVFRSDSAFSFALLLLLSFGAVGLCESCAGALQEVGVAGSILAHDCTSGLLPAYNDTRRAIHDGGAAWVSVVFDVLGCVEPVVRDELRAHNVLAELDAFELEQLTARIGAVIEASPDAARLQIEKLAYEFELDQGSLFASVDQEAPLPEGASRAELTRAKLAIAIERAALRVRLYRRLKAKP